MNDPNKRIPTDRDFRKFMSQISLEEQSRLHPGRSGCSLIVKLGVPLLAALVVFWSYLKMSGAWETVWAWCAALLHQSQ